MDDKLLNQIREIEESAEEVLSCKQEIVDIDRKRHSNREALRSLQFQSRSHWNGEDSKSWLAMGNTFMKLPNRLATELLEKDKVRYDLEINKLRSDLKIKVNQLRDKEGEPSLKGFDLVALDQDEIQAVRQVVGGTRIS